MGDEGLLKKIISLLEHSEVSGSDDERAIARRVRAAIGGCEKRDGGRFHYSTVGYGVFSLLGEKYRVGRIEEFDEGGERRTVEGAYCVPHSMSKEVENFLEGLSGELPIYVSIGSQESCRKACAEALGLGGPEELGRKDVVDRFRKAAGKNSKAGRVVSSEQQ